MRTNFWKAVSIAMILIGISGCTFPRLGPATQPPVATPLPQSTPTFPPPVTVTQPPIPLISHFAAGTQLILGEIHMISVKNGWALGTTAVDANTHVLHTIDGGLTWRDVTPPEPLDSAGAKTAIAHFATDSRLWVAYSLVQSTLQADPSLPALIWSSADGGATWQASNPLNAGQGFEFYTPGLLTFSDATHGWYLVHVGVGMSHDYVFFYSTRDGGATWTKLADPYGTDSFPQVCCKADMAFPDATHGWLAGNTNGVVPGVFFYSTADAGVTWSLVNLPAPTGSPAIFSTSNYACGTTQVDFLDPQNGFVGVVCFAQLKAPHLSWLYATHDGGATWAPLNPPQAQGQFQFLSPLEGWYVAGDVYETQDAGIHWTSRATVTWKGVPDFVDSANGWLIAINEGASALVRSTDAGKTWDILTPVIAP